MFPKSLEHMRDCERIAEHVRGSLFFLFVLFQGLNRQMNAVFVHRIYMRVGNPKKLPYVGGLTTLFSLWVGNPLSFAFGGAVALVDEGAGIIGRLVIG